MLPLSLVVADLKLQWSFNICKSTVTMQYGRIQDLASKVPLHWNRSPVCRLNGHVRTRSLRVCHRSNLGNYRARKQFMCANNPMCAGRGISDVPTVFLGLGIGLYKEGLRPGDAPVASYLFRIDL
jgi:hypothetical protein